MTVTVERAGNRIHLRADRKLSLKDKLPGASFSDRYGPRWSLPLTIEVCELMRELFGSQLVVGPLLHSWAVAKRREQGWATSLQRKKKAKLPVTRKRFPALYQAVRHGRKYQSVGARWIADGRRVLIADGVGLGKTLQALAGVVESGVEGPYLIVCPKIASTVVWAPEIRKWLPGHEVVTFPEGRVARQKAWRGLQEAPSLANTWVIVHPEMVRTKSWWVCRECGSETLLTSKPKLLVCEHDKDRTRTRHDHVFPEAFQHQWGAIICDESDRAILRLTGTPTMVRRGMEILRDDCVREDSLLVAQSATPHRSRRNLLWSTLNWIRPQEYPGYWSWLATFFQLSQGYGGSMVLGAPLPDREEAFSRSLDRVMLRRTRTEVAGHLPPRLYIGTHLDPADSNSPFGVWLDMSPTQAKLYRQMEESTSAELDGGDLSALGVLAITARLKQFATTSLARVGGEIVPEMPSNKLDYVVDMLEELGYPEEPNAKVVIVSQFTKVLELFARYLRLKYGAHEVVMVTGSVVGEARDRAVEAFNRPVGATGYNPHIMLLNTKAGGAAITLDSADEMVLLDETWTPDDQEQVEGRIDNRRPEERIVQRRYRYLRSLGTVEESIAKSVAALGADAYQVLDGRRGVKAMRQMLEV